MILKSETREKTPLSFHILTKAVTLARNDPTIAPALISTSQRIGYHLLRAVKLKHVESLLQTAALNKYSMIC